MQKVNRYNSDLRCCLNEKRLHKLKKKKKKKKERKKKKKKHSIKLKHCILLAKIHK